MSKMFFSSQNCYKATSALTGNTYHADKQGFIHVDNPADAKYLKDGGYVQAGGMPKFRKFWICDDCDWEASINHCPRCDSESLRRVER